LCGGASTEYTRKWDKQRQEALKSERLFNLKEGFRQLAQRDNFKKMIESLPDKPLDALQLISSSVLNLNGRRDLDVIEGALKPVLSDLKGQILATGLVEMAKRPLLYTGQEGVDDGWLEEVNVADRDLAWKTKSTGSTSGSMEDTEAVANVYCREWRAPVVEVIAALLRFDKLYPAERPWVILMLHQLQPICDEDANTEVSLKYFGQSYCLTAVGRGEDDAEAALPTRFNNFVAINELEGKLRYYTVIVSDDHLTESGPLDTLPLLFRANERLQQLESLLITCIGFSRLNSALGGSHPTFLAPKLAINIRDSMNVALDDLALHPERLEGLRQRPAREATTEEEDQQIENRFRFDVELWELKGQDSDFVEPSSEAMEEIRRHALSYRFTPDNYPESLSLLKDATEEELDVTAPQQLYFLGSRSGQSPATYREIASFLYADQTLLHPAVKPSLDLLRAKFFPFVNLWALTRKHRQILIAIICFIRHILSFESPVVKVYSSKVISLARQDSNWFKTDVLLYVDYRSLPSRQDPFDISRGCLRRRSRQVTQGRPLRSRLTFRPEVRFRKMEGTG
jgi:hypothetical protein